MSTIAHFITIPVDSMEIVKGCGAARLCEISSELESMWDRKQPRTYTVEQTFTFRTYASTKTFRRKLNLGQVEPVLGDEFYIAGNYNGKVFTGFYNTRTRTGDITWA